MGIATYKLTHLTTFAVMICLTILPYIIFFLAASISASGRTGLIWFMGLTSTQMIVSIMQVISTPFAKCGLCDLSVVCYLLLFLLGFIFLLFQVFADSTRNSFGILLLSYTWTVLSLPAKHVLIPLHVYLINLEKKLTDRFKDSDDQAKYTFNFGRLWTFSLFPIPEELQEEREVVRRRTANSKKDRSIKRKSVDQIIGDDEKMFFDWFFDVRRAYNP